VGDRARFSPATERFPESATSHPPQSIILQLPDGSIVTGAQAVFQLLSLKRGGRPLIWMYQNSSIFRWLTESIYRQVASHRNRVAD
jgi:predicted DCC family thiol-disulfide oxidoreductase YuxK